MQRSDETWHRLLDWNVGQVASERLAAQILLDQGFTNIEPLNHPDDPDHSANALAHKNRELWVMGLWFPRGNIPFSHTQQKFKADLAALAKNHATGIAFVTNQELTLGQRATLSALAAPSKIEIFHLERIAAILDQAHMANVRLLMYHQSEQQQAEILNNLHAEVRAKVRPHSSTFHLTRMHLENFRGFEHFDLELHPQLTILVANNGQGKSSVLDACRIALWQFVGCFDLALANVDATIDIQIADAHLQKSLDARLIRKLPVRIALTGQIGNAEELVWCRSRASETPGSSATSDEGAAWLTTWGKTLQREVREEHASPVSLPIVAYYGTERLWHRQPSQPGLANQPPREASSQIRTWAYRDCLTSSASFRQFSDWFQWIFTSHLQATLQNAEQGSTVGNAVDNAATSIWREAISVVQRAIDILLKDSTGWHTLEYSIAESSLVLHHDLQGKINVAQLSDGIRNMLALAGDLAWRCVQLNPHLASAAAHQTTGVVLIDELDMHLHPAWQQRICTQLQQAFPRIQFIVTTHSPQVLSTVDAACIRILHQAEASAQTVSEQTRGVTSADLLARVMEVNPVPDLPEARNLSRYRTLIDLGQHASDEGLILQQDLITHFGPRHPVMLECERMIRLQALKQRVAQSKKNGPAESQAISQADSRGDAEPDSRPGENDAQT